VLIGATMQAAIAPEMPAATLTMKAEHVGIFFEM
jgi:hypothetical protein